MFAQLLLACLALPAIFAEVYPPADLMEELVKPLHEMCTERLSITEEAHASYQLETNTPDMKCYMKCLMQESKWMTMAGEIDYDFILANAYPSIKHILDPAIAKCRVVEKGDDPCEYAYNFNICLKGADSVHWFLP